MIRYFIKNYLRLEILRLKNDLNKILEIKYSSKLDNYIRHQLSNIKLRVSKNSKFVNSIIK